MEESLRRHENSLVEDVKNKTCAFENFKQELEVHDAVEKTKIQEQKEKLRVYRENLDDQLLQKKAEQLEKFEMEKVAKYGLVGPQNKMDGYEEKLAKRKKGKKLQSDLKVLVDARKLRE